MNPKFLMAASFLGLAVSASTSNAYEVKGLWTFNGTDGAEIETSTAFENAIEGNDLSLVTSMSPQGGNKVRYDAGVPGGHLFGSLKLTEKIADLDSSLRLLGDSRYDGWQRGPSLRITNFGKMFKDKSWTVEMLVRVSATTPDGSYVSQWERPLLGVTGNGRQDEAAFGMDIMNHRLFKYVDSTSSYAFVPINMAPNRISGRDCGADVWKNVAITYDAEKKAFTYHSDYLDTLQSTSDSAADWAPLELSDDDFFQIGGTWKQSYYYVCGKIDVAAVRVSEGVVPWHEMMAPWVSAEPRELVHYRFSGENGTVVGNVANEVAPDLDFTLCAARDSANWSNALLGTIACTNEVCAPFIQTQRGRERLPNASAAVSCKDGTWNTFKVYLQNLPAFFQDSFTVEGIVYVQTQNFSSDFPQPAVCLFAAPAKGSTPECSTGFSVYNMQSVMSVSVRGVSEMQKVLQTNWGSCPFTRAAWHHYAVVFDASVRKIKLYLDGILQTHLSADGSVPEGAPIWNDYFNYVDYYAVIGGEAPNGWMSPCQGFVDEFRITRAALEPKDFLTGKRSQLGGLSVLLR